jgi:rare lipoprotein A
MAFARRLAEFARKAAVTAIAFRRCASVCSAAALAVAALYGCAQLETAPEPEPESASAPPAPPSAARAPSSPPARSPAATPESDQPARSTQLRGRISMYGAEFAGRTTASGDAFDPGGLTMAHPTLPFGTRVRVTNLENKRSVEVVVNDRGPFVAGRIADLSEAAAHRIGMVADGVVDALLDVLQQPRRGR